MLEIGCGNGALWKENFSRLPENIDVILSDISEGMIRDVRRVVGQEDERFHFEIFDCHQIPYPDQSFDLVIANHLLFYCDDIKKVCTEVRRVMKNGGRFLCSTYGSNHMKEISQLVQEFDNRILLSADKLYERFGLENGEKLLRPFFEGVQLMRYHDFLLINTPEPLIEYILSCHGNQNQYLLEKYKEFRNYVEKRTEKGFSITKDAGIFVSTVKQ